MNDKKKTDLIPITFKKTKEEQELFHWLNSMADRGYFIKHTLYAAYKNQESGMTMQIPKSEPIKLEIKKKEVSTSEEFKVNADRQELDIN